MAAAEGGIEKAVAQVIIIGAGPTGLALALELSAQAVPFRIIDKAAQRSERSRALVLQPRSLELLNRHCDVRQLVAQGNAVAGVQLYVDRRRVAEVDMGDNGVTDSAFPTPLMIPQSRTESFLDDVLWQKHGVRVERGLEASAIVQDDDGVTVDLMAADGSHSIVRTRFVVGCDGAHSCVRRAAASMTFDGGSYEQDFILADVSMEEGTLARDRIHMCFGNGLVSVIPLTGSLVRVFVTRPEMKGSDEEPTLQHFQDAVDRFVPGAGRLSAPQWITRFRLHHRGVNKYRDGRLLVAGDAAHVHSPAGGQGMNTGIGDSVNLGWKLAAVLKGDQPDSLLDTYNEERWPVGQHLLRSTDRMFSYAATTNPILLFVRNRLVLPWLAPCYMRSARRRARFFQFTSQVRIKYRTSSIVAAAPGWSGPIRPIRPGYRVPDARLSRSAPDGVSSAGPEREHVWFHELLHGPGHHLVLFSGPVAGPAATGRTGQAWAESLRADSNRDDHLRRQVRGLHHDVHCILGRDASRVVADGTHTTTTSYDADNRLHQHFGFDGPGYVLVRPDGHVATMGHFRADVLVAPAEGASWASRIRRAYTALRLRCSGHEVI